MLYPNVEAITQQLSPLRLFPLTVEPQTALRLVPMESIVGMTPDIPRVFFVSQEREVGFVFINPDGKVQGVDSTIVQEAFLQRLFYGPYVAQRKAFMARCFENIRATLRQAGKEYNQLLFGQCLKQDLPIEDYLKHRIHQIHDQWDERPIGGTALLAKHGVPLSESSWEAFAIRAYRHHRPLSAKK